MKLSTITPPQQRALAITLGLLLILTALFLRDFLIVIATAVIITYLFSPMYHRFNRRLGKGGAATATFFAALGIVFIPILAILYAVGRQAASMIGSLQSANLGDLGAQSLTAVNEFLASLPFGSYTVTEDQIVGRLTSAAQTVGSALPGYLSGVAGSFLEILTAAVVFIYLFFSLMTKQDKLVTVFKQLNPLGPKISDLYLAKTGAMVRATVKGQFIIALLQGISGVVSVYLAGLHEATFILFVLFTLLSFIPLGSGVIALPLGLGLMAFGNVGGGILVIVWHFLVTGTIDNVMRPILVPRAARLDAALVMLAVFAGIAYFGFIGIVLGPVFMILVTTTVDVYRAVHYDVALDTGQDEPPVGPSLVDRLKSLRQRLPL